MKAVVFDIGHVLVDWDPHLAWIDEMGSREAVTAFFDRTGFFDLNRRCDAGASFADVLQEVSDPADRACLESYLNRFALTVPNKIEGSWVLLRRLQARGVLLHAITNWPAEAWPIGLEVHPELAEAFGVIVVSGQEGLLKPQPEIYALLCERAGLAPDACIFIDDTLKNVEGARSVGMDAIHFTRPEALEDELVNRALL